MSQPDTPTTPKVKVFVSYAHEDEEEIGRVIGILKELRNVVYFVDREGIKGGDEFEKRLERELRTSHIVLLLITDSYFRSAPCICWEMPWAMDQHNQNEAVVIPILFSDIKNLRAWPFGKLSVLPGSSTPGKAWDSPEAAWDEIKTGIKDRVDEKLTGLKQRPRAEYVVKVYDSISAVIKDEIEKVSCISLLARTGMIWWEKFRRVFPTESEVRFLVLDPESDAFSMLEPTWEKSGSGGARNQTFQEYRDGARSFVQRCARETRPRLRVTTILSSWALLILDKELTNSDKGTISDKATIFVEYPTFHRIDQGGRILQITHQDRHYFEDFRKAFQELWQKGIDAAAAVRRQGEKQP
jgi:hypothetical protein